MHADLRGQREGRSKYSCAATRQKAPSARLILPTAAGRVQARRNAPNVLKQNAFSALPSRPTRVAATCPALTPRKVGAMVKHPAEAAGLRRLLPAPPLRVEN